jgi:Fe-S-cluster containining protein
MSLDEGLRAEIASGLGTLRTLQSLLPNMGPDELAKANQELNELISVEYEPYFCGNASLHLNAICQRCGQCCRDSSSIAVSIEDCRKIAKHLGMSLKKFLIIYTIPHTLKGKEMENARMIRKQENEHCPFYDPSLPGCQIHQFKPQVCKAAFYLSKMNLLLCEKNKEFSIFPQCPDDSDIRARIRDFGIRLRDDFEAKSDLHSAFQSNLPDFCLFHLLLRLKSMEIFFGQDKAAPLARRLGLKRMPSDEEPKPAAFLYAVILLEPQYEADRMDGF